LTATLKVPNIGGGRDMMYTWPNEGCGRRVLVADKDKVRWERGMKERRVLEKGRGAIKMT